MEEGKSLQEATKRETLEETGYNVAIGRLIGTYSFTRKNKTVVKRVFEAKIVLGKLKIPADEIDEVQWFSAYEVTNAADENKFTFGAVQSAKDYLAEKFEQEYECKRIP